MPTIKIAKFWRSIEAFGEICTRILGLGLVYLIFSFIGQELIGEQFKNDVLLSLVVLPAIYVLKDSHKILEAVFINVIAKDNSITVFSGILTKREDKLGFKSVENVEQVTTFLGRIFGYSTIHLYAYGSWVRIPFIKDPKSLRVWLEERIHH